MRNFTIALLVGLVVGLCIGASYGFSLVKPLFVEFDLNQDTFMSLIATVLGAAITVFGGVFLGSWKDRRAAATAAKAAMAASNNALNILRSVSGIRGNEHDFVRCLSDAQKIVQAAYDVIALAANGDGLHPDCAEAGYLAMDAINAAAWSLSLGQAKETASENQKYIDSAITAVKAFRDKACESSRLMT